MVNRITTGQGLWRMADMLLLHGTLTECTGLVHGKMGIAALDMKRTDSTELYGCGIILSARADRAFGWG